jgi:hypothetical protein
MSGVIVYCVDYRDIMLHHPRTARVSYPGPKTSLSLDEWIVPICLSGRPLNPNLKTSGGSTALDTTIWRLSLGTLRHDGLL